MNYNKILGNNMRKIAVFAMSAIMTGCGMSGSIVKQSDGTYFIHKEDHSGIFGDPGKIPGVVNKEITEFAAKEGKTVVPIADQTISMAPGRFAAYEVKFRLTDPKLKQESLDCFANLSQNPSLQIISDKISLSNAAPSFTMLANQSKPTPSEKNAIALWSDLRAHCLDLAQKAAEDSGTSPQLVDVFKRGGNTINAMTLDLYNDKLSYGDYNRLRYEAQNNLVAALNNVSYELKKNEQDSRLKAQHADNESKMARAMMMQAMEPPPRTNINCTSYKAGSMTSTTCY